MLRFLSSAILAVLMVGTATAQNYPTRPITFVVSFAPGGLSDVPARLLAAEMQKRTGATIVVENKPGASGVNGGHYVVRSEPDGYTLLVSAISEAQNLHYLSVPYNALTDLSPVGKIADGPTLVLIVNAQSEFKTLSDLIAFAKANPAKVNFSTSGPATSPAIAVSQLNSLAGTKIVEVAYRGTGPAAAAVASGEVQGAIVFYPSAKPLLDGGKVRVLAVTNAKRIESLPDVPTMAELGFKDFEHNAFVGLSAPRGTPKDVIATLNKYLNETISTPEFRKRLEPLGMTLPAQPNTPESYGKFLEKETAFQAGLAKLTGHGKKD